MVDWEQVTMSHQELDRAGVIRRVVEGELKQRQAAEQLSLSTRQIKRLVRRYRSDGPQGLVSRQRGKPSNNRICDEARDYCVGLIRAHYADFGPTLAQEKLSERHDVQYSVETIRHWMVNAGLWQPKPRRAHRVYQRRPRRPCRGELIQIDGSLHDWFEDRGPKCCLIVFIDDATGELGAMRFVPAESTQAYMETLADYLDQHGRPVALYSDRHSIFRVNNPTASGEPTQFTRALQTLDIGPIHANTPQAKGRVERANQTLQDRLVKELRLNHIQTLNKANQLLPEFIKDYNQRFAKPPQSPVDAHRPVLHNSKELKLILSKHYTRTLSKNLTCQLNHHEYQIINKGNGYRLQGHQVTLCQAFNGKTTILHKGAILEHRVFQPHHQPIPIKDEKSVQDTVERIKSQQKARPIRRPAKDHPWRKGFLL